MKSHRTAIVGLTAVALLLAGCTAGGGEGDSGDTTVTIWSWKPDDARAQPYLDAFSKAHPEIDVDFRFMQYTEYVSALKAALTAGEGPDVFGMQEGALAQEFAPLTEDLTPYAEEALGADWADQVTAVESMSADGKQVGMPWNLLGAGNVYYNKSMFDELGLEFPTTYDQLLDACAAIKASGAVCMVQGAKDAWQNLDLFQAIANQVDPGYVYDALVGEQPFDSPEMVEALEGFGRLFSDEVIQPGALAMTAYPEAEDLFVTGGAGIVMFGTWANTYTTSEIDMRADEQYGDPSIKDRVFMPAELPAIVDDATTGTMFGGPDLGWAMSSSSGSKDAAWTFIEWMVTADESTQLIGLTLAKPALVSAPVDSSDVKSDEQKAAVEALSEKVADIVGSREVSDPDIKQALSDALAAVAAGTQTPANAAAAVQTVIDTVY